jgi:hypothetical protein
VEEQGWVARMIHLFRSSDLDSQYEVIAFIARLLMFNTFITFIDSSWLLRVVTSTKAATECDIPSHL